MRHESASEFTGLRKSMARARTVSFGSRYAMDNMIYLSDTRHYMKLPRLHSTTMTQPRGERPGRYRKMWNQLDRRLMPDRNLHAIFLRTFRYRMWMMVLETLLRSRMLAGEIGLCTVWSPDQCRLTGRMALLLPIFVARNMNKNTDVRYIQLLMTLLHPSVFGHGFNACMTVPLSCELAAISGTFSVASPEHSVMCSLNAVERYLSEEVSSRPFSKMVCWNCRGCAKKTQKCRCLIARYCDENCQRHDWVRHKRECKFLEQVVNTHVGEKLLKMQGSQRRSMTLGAALRRVVVTNRLGGAIAEIHALGPASEIVNDQHASYVASIIAIKNQQKAIAKTVGDENNRIRIEQEVQGVCGYDNDSEDDSEPEPWKDHMVQGSSRRKCNKCMKPYWEWRLGQDACEMCQLKAGWNKGCDSKQDKAERLLGMSQRHNQPPATRYSQRSRQWQRQRQSLWRRRQRPGGQKGKSKTQK